MNEVTLFFSQEKELYMSITVENDKLLVERRRLLEQLNEEEHNKKDSNLTATLSKCRYWTDSQHLAAWWVHTLCSTETAKVISRAIHQFTPHWVNLCWTDNNVCFDLKGGFSGDGKQETWQQNTPYVQSTSYPGTQPAEHAVISLCWGTIRN